MQLVEGVGDDEVLALLLERLDRTRGALADPLEQKSDALAGEVRVLLAPRQCELLLDDLLRQHEPAIAVAGRSDVLERSESVEAGKQRHGKSSAGRIQPDG